MHLRRITLHPDKYPVTDHYPFNQPILRDTTQISFTSPVTFFVGENGTGKTTLLEAITRKCGIHIWRGAERGRYEVNPYDDQLYRYITVEWENGMVPGSFFGSDTFRYFTHSLDEWASVDSRILKYFGGESLVTKSHGQSIMAYFRSRYQIVGLYILDEPETALSPKSQLWLVRILREMGNAGHAQFIVATHSPILLACPEAHILSFDTVPIRRVLYRDTDYYRLYKKFMDNPDKYVAGSIADGR